MKNTYFSRRFIGPAAVGIVVAAFLLIFSVAPRTDISSVTDDDIPLPFSFGATNNFAGQLVTLGQKRGVTVRQFSFDDGEETKILRGGESLDSMDFILTPDDDTISHGAGLCQALSRDGRYFRGGKYFGYKYTSRDATTEKDRQQWGAGVPLAFATLFPGEFFSSLDQRLDASVIDIPVFEKNNRITFVDSCNVRLEKNARYVIKVMGTHMTFTARGLSICGNGTIEEGEWCDDGNTKSGDGCSSMCQAEDTYACYGEPSVCAQTCGNSIVDAGEQCDHSGMNGPQYDGGCSRYGCQPRIGWVCEPETNICYPKNCGDGHKDWMADERCDDGNRDAGDGCDARCRVEPGWGCSEYMDSPTSVCSPLCGNGKRDAPEECDDGNNIDGDGCSANCSAVEKDWFCTTEWNSLSVCTGQPLLRALSWQGKKFVSRNVLYAVDQTGIFRSEDFGLTAQVIGPELVRDNGDRISSATLLSVEPLTIRAQYERCFSGFAQVACNSGEPQLSRTSEEGTFVLGTNNTWNIVHSTVTDNLKYVTINGQELTILRDNIVKPGTSVTVGKDFGVDLTHILVHNGRVYVSDKNGYIHSTDGNLYGWTKHSLKVVRQIDGLLHDGQSLIIVSGDSLYRWTQ